MARRSSLDTAIGGLSDFSNIFRQLPERKLLLRTDDPDFTVEAITDSYASMLGIDREQVLGHPYFDVFPHSSGEFDGLREIAGLSRAFRAVIRTRKPQERHIFRHDIPDPTDQTRLVERYWRTTLYPVIGAKGEVDHIIQVSANATSEVLAARELEEVRLHLDEALEAGKVGTWTWDAATNMVIGNAGLAGIFHLPTKWTEEGKPLEAYIERVHPEDRERLKRAFRGATEKKNTFDVEFRIGSGKLTRWVIGRGRMLIHGGTKQFSGVAVDVTERRDLQAQIELARRQDRLNRAEAKLLQQRNEELQTISRTKDEFVAIASHQLRTPATAVKQYLGMVLQGYAGDITPLQQDMLTKAFDSNERQIEIINQILNAARADTGKLVMTIAPFDLSAMIRGVVEEQRAAVGGHEHELVASIPVHPFVFHGDPGYMRMAVENLISNADKYTPPKGKITVTLTFSETAVSIIVADTGVGIHKKDLDKLFEKFSRIHNPLSVKAGGSGVGLYLVSEIVKLHNGTITVNSVPNRGTTFTIHLPIEQT